MSCDVTVLIMLQFVEASRFLCQFWAMVEKTGAILAGFGGLAASPWQAWKRSPAPDDDALVVSSRAGAIGGDRGRSGLIGIRSRGPPWQAWKRSPTSRR